MSFNRLIIKYLSDWKNSSKRKPLVIRGARQVGKTTLVRKFGEQYGQYIELNLEKPNDQRLFEPDDIRIITESILLQRGIGKPSNETILFIDEIQESSKAISMLRYFKEEKPEIHVIAAGSLLEFATKEVELFPVGRVEYIYVHPLNFLEYLPILHSEEITNKLNTIPIADHLHDFLLKIYHNYVIIGGMPEIVDSFKENQQIGGLLTIYHSIWQTYVEDVEKYATNQTYKNIIRHIMTTSPNQPDRIKFERFGNSNYKSREVGEAFRALDKSKIIQLIYPTTSVVPPIATDYKKRPRLQFLDTGILNYALKAHGELITLTDFNDYYKGRIIQQMVHQELISLYNHESFKPHFWVREEGNTNSEVDIVFKHGKYLIPIEIKSGASGSLKSLHQFIERTNHRFAVRLYAGKFNVERSVTAIHKVPYILMNLPYYLTCKLPQYLDWFLENYKMDGNIEKGS